MIQVFILPVKQWSVAHILAIEIPLKMLSSKKKKNGFLSVAVSLTGNMPQIFLRGNHTV